MITVMYNNTMNVDVYALENTGSEIPGRQSISTTSHNHGQCNRLSSNSTK